MKLSDKKLSLMKENYYAEKDVKEFIKEILEEIENTIDHYEPYRPISDSSEAKEVRKVLSLLGEFIITKAGELGE